MRWKQSIFLLVLVSYNPLIECFRYANRLSEFTPLNGNRFSRNCISERKNTSLFQHNAEALNAEKLSDFKYVKPKIGDVVQYTGKWNHDIYVGEIRGLQYIAARDEWIADILPLKDIGKNQYARKRGWGTVTEKVESLKPIKAIYVSSSNAFQARTQSDRPGDFRYVSDRYDLVDFKLPEQKQVSIPAEDVEEYQALKLRLLKDALIFGAVGSTIAAVAVGLENGSIYALGTLSAVFYIGLLERNVDKIGTGGEAKFSAGRRRGSREFEATRFAIPVALTIFLAAAHYIKDPSDTRIFSVIPKNQFSSAMLGFLATYRLPLLYREAVGRIRLEEASEFIPGSVFQGARLLQGMKREELSGKTDSTTTTRGVTAIIISSPRGIRRSRLVDRLIAERDDLYRPIWCTTRPKKEFEVDGKDYYFISPERFEQEAKGAEPSTGFVRVEKRDEELLGLRYSELCGSSAMKKKAVIIDADCDVVKDIAKMKEIDPIGIWISLSSLEKIKESIRSSLMDDGEFAADGEALENEVRARAKRAVDDIEYAVTSNIFEFTVIDGDEDDCLGKVRKAIEYAA